MSLTKEDLQAIGSLMDSKIEPIHQRLDIMQVDITGMKGAITGMKGDIAGLREDVEGLREDVEILKEDSEITREATNILLEWANEMDKTALQYVIKKRALEQSKPLE